MGGGGGGREKPQWKEREFPAEKGFGKADPRALASDSQSSSEEGEIRAGMEKMGLHTLSLYIYLNHFLRLSAPEARHAAFRVISFFLQSTTHAQQGALRG